MITYEEQLRRDHRWAFQEGSMHFERDSQVQQTLLRLTAKLNQMGVDYAIAGGMALFFHGYRRFTEDIDILVNRDGLKQIHNQLEGLGYIPPFTGSKNLRDTDSGVKIEFIVAGDYPGDGQPKPVSFPEPATVAESIDGMSFLNVTALVELKLASGQTNPRRGKDLVDVQELIAILQLPEEFAERLNPFVQDKYRELWRIVKEFPQES